MTFFHSGTDLSLVHQDYWRLVNKVMILLDCVTLPGTINATINVLSFYGTPIRIFDVDTCDVYYSFHNCLNYFVLW